MKGFGQRGNGAGKAQCWNKDSKTRFAKRTTPQIHPANLENKVGSLKKCENKTYHDETGKVPSWFN